MEGCLTCLCKHGARQTRNYPRFLAVCPLERFGVQGGRNERVIMNVLCSVLYEKVGDRP